MKKIQPKFKIGQTIYEITDSSVMLDYCNPKDVIKKFVCTKITKEGDEFIYRGKRKYSGTKLKMVHKTGQPFPDFKQDNSHLFAELEDAKKNVIEYHKYVINTHKSMINAIEKFKI